MNVNYFISGLEFSGKKIELFLKDISTEQAIWKPQSDRWSVLEVVNHLADEEKDDFRKRLELTLFHPGTEWPGIDPVKWAKERKYNHRDLLQSVTSFKEERQISLKWLKTVGAADFAKFYQHPLIGKLTAGDLLASWLCHDYLHLRQLTTLQIEYLASLAKPHSTRYASP